MSLKTKNKKVAVPRAVLLDAKLTAGNYKTAPAPTTINEAIDAYLEFLQTEERARGTITRYAGELHNFQSLSASEQATRLAQINPTLFDRFRAHCKQMGHFPATMFHESIVVKQWLKWCHRRHLVAENRLADYKLKKPEREPRDGPNLEQVNKILTAALGQRRIQYALLAFTGMRSGDAKRLHPEDVDLEQGWIKIVSRKDAETKTRRSRKVPIHPRLHALLTTMPKNKRPWFFMAGPSPRYPQGDNWINPNRLNDDFLALLSKLKLPAGRKQDGFTIHSLRHFFETFCVNARIPQRVIDTWLGHRSDQSMAAVYYKLSDVDSQAFMDEVPFGEGTPAADAGDRKD
jgi:integrase